MSEELVVVEQVAAPKKSQEEIDKLKVQFGKIFFILIDGEEYYYRPMNRKEYKDIYSNAAIVEDKFMLEQSITQHCTVSPQMTMEYFQIKPAGIVSLLSDLILEVSSFVPDSKPIQL